MAQRDVSSALPERAKRGDDASFRAIVLHYDRGLRSLAFRLLGSRERMDDAIQEAYVKAFRAVPGFRGAASLGTWLYRIAYNACLDELERGRRVVPLPLDVAEGRPDGRALETEVAERTALADALRDLPLTDRAAVLLVDAQGFTYDEAAEILGVPAGTVASRLARARAALRRTLEEPLAVVALGFGIFRLGGRGLDVATAAEVKAKVRAALRSAAQMQGRLVEVSRDPLTRAPVTRRWNFATTANGDFRVVELGGPGRVAYDAERGIERQLNESASIGSGLFGSERSGLAPGLPDPGPTIFILERDLGAVVRALLAARHAQVEEISYLGREAWRVDLPVRPNAIYADADRFVVTVDQAAGLPVRVVETLRGERTRELRVEDLRLDRPLAADAFTLRFPPGVEVAHTDYGFRRLPLAEVPAAVGYAPLVPDWVPDGYSLSEVAVASDAPPTGTEAGNPPSEDVVSLAYRRGFDEILVTSRRAGNEAWDDPLATGEGFIDDAVEVPVEQGALAGAEAEVLVAPRAVPHFWAVADGLVVTVSGDASRGELVRSQPRCSAIDRS
jgi:RNA polymerase sigma-70 factor, ECF subfamily